MPGYLVPGDIQRMAERLNEPDLAQFAFDNLLASPGAIVIANGAYRTIPTLVPARKPDGSCRFLKIWNVCWTIGILLVETRENAAFGHYLGLADCYLPYLWLKQNKSVSASARRAENRRRYLCRTETLPQKSIDLVYGHGD
jgi:hypothetical protein